MRTKVILLLATVPLLLCLQCKKCKEGENRENREMPVDQRKAIFHFLEGTRWVFKSNVGDMDTVYLGPLVYFYDDGYCKDDPKGCCTKIYTQILKQNLNYVEDVDGLDKFVDFNNYHLEYSLRSLGAGSFTFSNNQWFYNDYKEVLVVNGTTLSDVKSRSVPAGTILGDIYPDIAYWSLSKGLVRYDYQNANATYTVYERQDL
jgi:hypothetical protein